MRDYKMSKDDANNLPNTATLLLTALINVDESRNYTDNANRIIESYGIDSKYLSKQPINEKRVIDSYNPLVVLSMLREKGDTNAIAEMVGAIDNLDNVVSMYHEKYKNDIEESMNKAITALNTITVKK